MFLILILTGCKEFMLIMLMSQDFLGLTPGDKVYHVVRAEILLQGLNSLKHNDQQVLGFYLRLWMQTVVTVVAVVLQILLAKVVEQHLTTADG